MGVGALRLMTARATPFDSRLLVAGLGVGVVATTLSAFVNAAGVVLTPGLSVGTEAGLAALVGAWVPTLCRNVAYLIAVGAVVASATRRTVAVGAGLVYTVDLGVGALPYLVAGTAVPLARLPIPLERVAAYLGVATVVWLAHHGGYERLTDAVGRRCRIATARATADPIGLGVSLRHGAVAVGLATLVGLGGVTVTEQLSTAVGTTGLGVYGTFSMAGGVSPAQLPGTVFARAAFLLGVVLVTRPRLRPRPLGGAVALVAGVEWAVAYLRIVRGVVPVVHVWAPQGPVVAPVAPVVTLGAIAATVRLAGSHDANAGVPQQSTQPTE